MFKNKYTINILKIIWFLLKWYGHQGKNFKIKIPNKIKSNEYKLKFEYFLYWIIGNNSIKWVIKIKINCINQYLYFNIFFFTKSRSHIPIIATSKEG